MANEEHLTRLKQGTRNWNAWRKEHPELRPDLSYADLSNTDLIKVNLFRAGLYRANFSGANLTDSTLFESEPREANFSGAILKRVDLEGAYFYATDFSGANLEEVTSFWTNFEAANFSGANFRSARFPGAIFNRTVFTQADFSGAYIASAQFNDVDLSTVIGLETVEHGGPSSIGIDTFYRSEGHIPESFLRKAGIPEDFLTYLPSLMNHALKYYTCFISYSSKDQDFAERLHADLQSKGVRCWFAPEDLKIGDKFWHRIDESIRLYDKLVVVLSEHSVESEWVEREVMAALEKEQQRRQLVLFPLTLDEAVMHTTLPWAANIRRTRHIGNFTNWKQHDDYQKALTRLLRDLKQDTPTTRQDTSPA